MNRRGSAPGPRPHTWKSGPDPVEHGKYLNWLQQRTQARFRKEPWDLTFEQWKSVWGDLWHNKGRAADDLCMTRRDTTDSWCQHNVEIITRREHVLRQAASRPQGWRRGRKAGIKI